MRMSDKSMQALLRLSAGDAAFDDLHRNTRHALRVRGLVDEDGEPLVSFEMKTNERNTKLATVHHRGREFGTVHKWNDGWIFAPVGEDFEMQPMMQTGTALGALRSVTIWIAKQEQEHERGAA